MTILRIDFQETIYFGVICPFEDLAVLVVTSHGAKDIPHNQCSIYTFYYPHIILRVSDSLPFPHSIVSNIKKPSHRYPPDGLNFGERCLNAHILEGSQAYTMCWCISFSLRGKINVANSTNNKNFGGNSKKLAVFFPSERSYSVVDLTAWMEVVNPTHILRSKPQFSVSPKAFNFLARGKYLKSGPPLTIMQSI